MTLEIAEKVWRLYDELRELEFSKHGIYKSMLSQDIIEQRVIEYNNRIEEIKKELTEL